MEKISQETQTFGSCGSLEISVEEHFSQEGARPQAGSQTPKDVNYDDSDSKQNTYKIFKYSEFEKAMDMQLRNMDMDDVKQLNEKLSEMVFVIDDDLFVDEFSGDYFDFANLKTVSDNYCHHKDTLKCPCMCNFKKGKFYYFDSVLVDDLRMIVQELKIDLSVGSQDSKVLYARHFATVIALTTNDLKIRFDSTSIHESSFYTYLYELRRLYGDNSDHGRKERCFVSQSDDTKQDVNSSSFIEKLLNFARKPYDKVVELVSKVMDTVVGWMSSLCDAISVKFAKFVNYVLKKITNMIVSNFEPFSYLKKEEANWTKFNTCMVICTILLVFLAIDMLGILTFVISKKVINLIFEKFIDRNGMISQGPEPSSVTGIVFLLGSVLGLAKGDSKYLLEKARLFTQLVSAGISAKFLFSSLFLILPPIVRTALTLKFGDKEERERAIIDNWLVRAQALIQLSKMPKVIITTKYFDWIKESMQHGMELKKFVRQPTTSAIFLRTYSNLTRISLLLRTFHSEGSDRDYPFSFHLYADPGCTKTLISSKIVKDLFDAEDNYIYFKPISSEFWDGYIGQKYIIWDEFLIGSPDQRAKDVNQYLELVSNKIFQPPLASVDDPIVGLKGTRCEPEVVITINNDDYCSPDYAPANAVNRRRNFVVRARIANDFKKWFNGNRFELNNLTDEQFRNVEWLTFDIKPAVDRTGPTVRDVTYRELVAFIKTHYEEHKHVCQRIRTEMRNEIEPEKDPVEMLDDILRTMNGIPNEKLSVTDALLKVITDSGDGISSLFSSQGKGKRKVRKESVEHDQPENVDDGKTQESETLATKIGNEFTERIKSEIKDLMDQSVASPEVVKEKEDDILRIDQDVVDKASVVQPNESVESLVSRVRKSLAETVSEANDPPVIVTTEDCVFEPDLSKVTDPKVKAFCENAVKEKLTEYTNKLKALTVLLARSKPVVDGEYHSAESSDEDVADKTMAEFMHEIENGGYKEMLEVNSVPHQFSQLVHEHLCLLCGDKYTHSHHKIFDQHLNVCNRCSFNCYLASRELTSSSSLFLEEFAPKVMDSTWLKLGNYYVKHKLFHDFSKTFKRISCEKTREFNRKMYEHMALKMVKMEALTTSNGDRPWPKNFYDNLQRFLLTLELEGQTQKDVFAMLDHSNVDPKFKHRHLCSYCKGSFAHSHDNYDPHPMLCKQCSAEGRESRYYDRKDPFRPANLPKPMSMCDLVPDEPSYISMDYLSEEEIKKIMDKFEEEAIKRFLDYRDIPFYYVDFNDDEPVFAETSATNMFKAWFRVVAKSTAVAVAIYALVKGVSNIISGGNKEEEICFSPQSLPRNKISNRSSKAKSFYKGTHYSSQGSDYKGVTLIIDGCDVYGYPVDGRTLLTYLHAFQIKDKTGSNDDVLIPKNTSIIVSYAGKKDRFNFDSSMLKYNPEYDMAFLTLPPEVKVDMFPKNIKNFWTTSDAETFIAGNALLQNAADRMYITVSKQENRNYAIKSLNKKIYLNECLQYCAPTKKGDCGSMIFSTGSSSPGKIMGMHIAGGVVNGKDQGLAVIVTREDVMNALNDEPQRFDEEGDYEAQGDFDDCAAFIREEKVPFSEQVHSPSKSKLEKSAISSFLPWEPEKHFPLMSEKDPRCEGQDPAINMLKDTLNFKQPELDQKIFEEVASEMDEIYDELVFPIPKKKLTIEEAIGGIPGVLSSLTVNTSPGYPLCKIYSEPGKRGAFKFDLDGKLQIDPSFRQMVLERDVYLRENLLKESDDRFLVFLKDEAVSEKKIKEKRVRLIYCANLISNVVFRQYFGPLIVAFNRAYEYTPSVIGLNQYSYDMDIIYSYLTQVGNNFIAGDFKNFDKSMIHVVQEYAYGLLMRLSGDFVPENLKKNFVKIQCHSPVQYKDRKIYLTSSHFSGCFFTTILNGIVHEFYIRYVFKKIYPELCFDDHVRMKILGDDNIYCVSDNVPRFNPLSISEELSKIGLTYTSDDKISELTESYRTFEDITFLGAHPKLLNGQYCGALKKSSLMETVHWTRNKNATLVSECINVLEMCSLWGYDFFAYMRDSLGDAFKQIGLNIIHKLPRFHKSLNIVPRRTASVNADYVCFTAHAEMGEFESQGNSDLTQLQQEVAVSSDIGGPTDNKATRMNRTINHSTADINSGTDSTLFRTQFAWSTSSGIGDVLFKASVPYGILDLGDPDNIQNMPFNNFEYWTGDVEISFQVNGTPQHQGLLCIYFMPLCEHHPSTADLTATNHVLLQPDMNSTVTLNIPYKFWRDTMKNFHSDSSLGYVYVSVLAPLRTVTTQAVYVSIFTRFPNSRFSIPKAHESSTYVEIENPVVGPSVDVGTRELEGLWKKKDEGFEAQGAGQSTVLNNTYTVAGNLSMEGISNSAPTHAEQVPTMTNSVEPIGLDNPPLSSGAVPNAPTFSGMACSHGVRPTTDLQLYPSALAKNHLELFNPADTKMKYILGQKCLLKTFELKTSDNVQKLLFYSNLDSKFSLADGVVPMNIAVLNQFMFWRADIKFDVTVVRTRFHSCRLQFVSGYGSPVQATISRNKSPSSMLTYANEVSTHSVIVPFNAPTEFLRTWDGGNGRTLDYLYGSVGLFLSNKLVCPDNVNPTVDVLVFISFVNPKVAVVRALSPFTFADSDQLKLRFTPETVTLNTKQVPTGTSNIKAKSSDKRTATLGSVSIVTTGGTPMDGVTYYVEGNARVAFHTPDSKEIQADVQKFVRVGEEYLITITQPLAFNWEDVVEMRISTAYQPLKFTARASSDLQSFESQGHDILEVQPIESTGEIETIELTKEETPIKEDRPCKLEEYGKFPFCVSDVIEIVRRYILVSQQPQNVKSTKSKTGTVDKKYLNYSTIPLHPWTRLYSAWAGSLKYRIFGNPSNESQVYFAPYNNLRDINVPTLGCFKSGDYFQVSSTVVGMTTDIGFPFATERLFPMTTEANWGDYSVPFQTHFNFLNLDKDGISVPRSSGTLTVSLGNKGTTPELYLAAGDDFRLFCFRPPPSCTLNRDAYKQGVNGYI